MELVDLVLAELDAAAGGSGTRHIEGFFVSTHPLTKRNLEKLSSSCVCFDRFSTVKVTRVLAQKVF